MYIRSVNDAIKANGKYVNKIGEYLYRHIDSATDYKKSPNMYDVYMNVYYQAPTRTLDPLSKQKESLSDLQEFPIDINITTYDDKIRVNLLLDDENETTLDFKTYTLTNPVNYEKLRIDVMKRIYKVLNKLFEGYEFIF